MENTYAIALFNKEEDYIIKPFLSNVPKIDKLVIISNKNSEYEELKRRMVDFFDVINVVTDFVYVDDITNFFQTFFTVRALCMQEGSPAWVNISCGSGIGMIALAIHALKRDIKMVVYEKESDKTVIVDSKKLQKINIFDPRYFNLLVDIANGKNTISKLAESNNIDKSLVSRRIKNMMEMEIVKKLIDGKGNKPCILTLTEFGKSILQKL
jgi:DNA-binding MarR family transcriptional regulator